MAGNITVLPARRTGFQEFSEAFTPYIQKAFEIQMQRKLEKEKQDMALAQWKKQQEIQNQMTQAMQEQERQKGMERLRQYAPSLFTPQYQQAAQAQGTPISLMPGLPPERQQEVSKQLYEKKYGANVPPEYLKFSMEKAQQYPGLDLESAGIPYKVPDTLKFEKENRLLKNQEKGRANLLRREFIDRPEIKEFTSIRNKVSSMDALLKNVNNENSKLALDQGLITLFNKITDPNSVVRESEYERTPSNLSLANRFSGAIQKLNKGGAGLTNDDRKSLVWGAKIIANEQGKMFNEKMGQYSDIAMAYGIEPSLITAGLEQYIPYKFEENETMQPNQQPQVQSGWTQDKELRYQELLRKQRGE